MECCDEFGELFKFRVKDQVTFNYVIKLNKENFDSS